MPGSSQIDATTRPVGAPAYAAPVTTTTDATPAADDTEPIRPIAADAVDGWDVEADVVYEDGPIVVRAAYQAISDAPTNFVTDYNINANGEIVAAMIDGEATVKTFQRKNGHIWLLPANPAFEPINGDNCEILGKVTAVMRSVR